MNWKTRCALALGNCVSDVSFLPEAIPSVKAHEGNKLVMRIDLLNIRQRCLLTEVCCLCFVTCWQERKILKISFKPKFNQLANIASLWMILSTIKNSRLLQISCFFYDSQFFTLHFSVAIIEEFNDKIQARFLQWR